MKPYIIVAGFGRCGSSLTMTMLHAAGIPCIGTPPDFEVRQISFGKVASDYLAAHQEHAFKMINPLETKLPPSLGAAVVIWLDRVVEQQARSQAKFAHLAMGIPMATRAHLRQWASNLRRDRSPALATFRDWPRLHLSFEGIIRKPDAAAAQIAAFLAPWWPDLDTARMAAVVLPRSTDCAPGLAIEELASARHAG